MSIAPEYGFCTTTAFDANDPKHKTRRTVGELIEFLSTIPKETLLGAWAYKEDGVDLIDGLELNLKRFEHRKYLGMGRGQWGSQWLLACLEFTPERTSGPPRNTLGAGRDIDKRVQQIVGIAESIINALLPDSIEDRTDMVEEDYQLKSDLDTFENFTGKSLYDPRGDDEGDDDLDTCDECGMPTGECECD